MRKHLRTSFFGVLMVLFGTEAIGQVRYPIWFTPSGAREIDGVAVGLMASDELTDDQTINGINAEVGPWGALMVFAFPFATAAAPFGKSTEEGQALWSKDSFVSPGPARVHVNGINVSLGGLGGDIEMNGISLNGIYTHTRASRLFSAALCVNFTGEFTGAMMSLRNKATTGSGLMFGFFNSCSDCRGVQLGLMNRMGNGKRYIILPLINVRFSKKDNSRYGLRRK